MSQGAKSNRGREGHLKGVFHGAIAGSAVVTLGFNAVLIASSPPPSSSEVLYSIGNMLVFSIYASVVAFSAFALGILLVSLPAQWGLRRMRMANAFTATAAGFVISGCVALAFVFRGDVWALSWIPITAVAGGFAGFTYFRTSADRS